MVPVVWPLVLTTGRGAWGAGAGVACAAFSEGRSTTCLASCGRAGAGAGALFDAAGATAMLTSRVESSEKHHST